MVNGLYSLANRPVGFSTGCLYQKGRNLNTYSPEAIRVVANHSLEAIEVMCASADHVKYLPAMVPWLKEFKLKSIHLPVINTRYANNRETRLMLGKITEFYEAIDARLAVVHPDLVSDWKVFKISPMQFAVENMDNTKSCFRYPEEFVGFFERQPDWRLVLDLQHCYTNDKTLASADEFIRLFSDRLAEIHLSGCDRDKYHWPLYLTDQTVIVEKIPAGDCPIIIESPFKDFLRDLKQELSFINFHS